MLYRQPQTFPQKIDRGNPICLGIVDTIIPFQKISASLVAGAPSTNANITMEPRPQGMAMVVAGNTTTDSFSFGGSTGPLVIAGPLTMLSVYRLTTVPSGAQRVAGTLTTGGGGGYAIAPNGSNFRWLTGNSGAHICVGAAVSTAFKIDIGTEASNGDLNFYENGILTGTVTGTTNNALGTTFKVGNSDGDNSAKAEHYLHVVWNRVLSSLEIASLSANPWQVLLDEDEEDYVLYVQAAGGDVTVDITGQSATASAGTVTATDDLVLGGQSATSAAGTLTPTTTIALSGQAATTSAGTLVPASAVALGGAGSTASAGDVSPSTSVALAGQAATGAQESMIVVGDVTVALSGEVMAITQGLLTRLMDVSDAGGGFFEVPHVPRHRSVREERERLGIFPRAVKQIAVAVARASVVADKTDHQAQVQLEQRLAQQHIEAQARYVEFMKQERDRLLARDIERALRIRQRQYELDEDEREAEMLLM